MWEIYLVAISLTLIGAFLEYAACKVKLLGVLLPGALTVGIILFIAADQRHAAELLAMGTLPEALALFMGLLIMVPLLVGMIFGWIFYYVRTNKSQ